MKTARELNINKRTYFNTATPPKAKKIPSHETQTLELINEYPDTITVS